MKNSKENIYSEDLINNIFNGSVVIMGVCLAVVILFHITDKVTADRIDECFCVATGLNLIAMPFVHVSARYADRSFLLATLSLFISCFVLIIEFYYYA